MTASTQAYDSSLHQLFTQYADRRIHQASGYRGASWNAELIAGLSLAQHALGVFGSVGEIGVHHGKLFILLYLSRAKGEGAFCIDLFGDQAENIDGSGKGDKDKFLDQLRRFANSEGRDIQILQRNSMSVAPQEILDGAGPVRLMSVDGGHYAEVVESDLYLAQRVMTAGGVAVLDDYSNHNWPDVAFGTARYLLRSDATLIPFMTCENKVYFTTDAEWSANYQRRLAGDLKHLVRGYNALNGHRVIVMATRYRPPGYPLTAKAALKRWVPRALVNTLKPHRAKN